MKYLNVIIHRIYINSQQEAVIVCFLAALFMNILLTFTKKNYQKNSIKIFIKNITKIQSTYNRDNYVIVKIILQ